MELQINLLHLLNDSCVYILNIKYNSYIMTNNDNRKLIEKNIFLLNWNGWEEDKKELYNQVYNSWNYQNKDWKIHLISKFNIKEYIDVPYLFNDNIKIQAKSDIIRVNVLDRYGGIWADSTLICVQPLNNWINDKTKVNGFWMYKGKTHNEKEKINDKHVHPCSWFIASVKNSYIINEWKKYIDIFWNNNYNLNNYSYFWLDKTFMHCYYTDNKFKMQWDNVDYIYADDVGESHYLAKQSPEKICQNYKDVIFKNPPYVMKLLSRWNYKFENIILNNQDKMFDYNNFESSNGIFTLYLGQGINPYFTYKFIIARYNENIDWLYKCKKNTIIYNKGKDDLNVSFNIEKLPNIGRESHTYIHYIIKNYHNLPDIVVFSQGSIYDHYIYDSMGSSFYDLIKLKNDAAVNGISQNWTDKYDIAYYDFKIKDCTSAKGLTYVNSDSGYKFGEWFENFLQIKYPEEKFKIYIAGIFAVKKENILKHSINYYKNIIDCLQTQHPESGHFMERSWYYIFK